MSHVITVRMYLCSPHSLRGTAETLARLNKMIEKLRDSITGYKWMTVIPQLTSRICHKEPEVYRLLSVGSPLLRTLSDVERC